MVFGATCSTKLPQERSDEEAGGSECDLYLIRKQLYDREKIDARLARVRKALKIESESSLLGGSANMARTY